MDFIFFSPAAFYIVYVFDEWAKKLDDDIEKCVSSHTERKWNHVKSAVARSPKYRLTQSREKNRNLMKENFCYTHKLCTTSCGCGDANLWSCFPRNKSNRWQVFSTFGKVYFFLTFIKELRTEFTCKNVSGCCKGIRCNGIIHLLETIRGDWNGETVRGDWNGEWKVMKIG